MLVRVILRAQGEQYDLLEAPRVDMVLPATAPAPATPGGVYAEVRNDNGQTLLQHDLTAQIGDDLELFARDQDIQRVTLPREHIVTLLIPEQEAADLLILRAPAPGRVRSQAAQEPLATFSLRKQP